MNKHSHFPHEHPQTHKNFSPIISILDSYKAFAFSFTKMKPIKKKPHLRIITNHQIFKTKHINQIIIIIIRTPNKINKNFTFQAPRHQK